MIVSFSVRQIEKFASSSQVSDQKVQWVVT